MHENHCKEQSIVKIFSYLDGSCEKQSSQIWHRIIWQKITNVSSVLTMQEAVSSERLVNLLRDTVASHPRRHFSF